MVITALARLGHRSEQLTAKLASGTAGDVKAARELLRLSMVELYKLGHWRERPEEFKTYMRLYRATCPSIFIVPLSRSAPDRMGRYNP